MQEHSTLLLLAIHQNSHRMLEANMAHILRFLYRRHRIQYLLIDESTPKEVRFWKKWVP